MKKSIKSKKDKPIRPAMDILKQNIDSQQPKKASRKPVKFSDDDTKIIADIIKTILKSE